MSVMSEDGAPVIPLALVFEYLCALGPRGEQRVMRILEDNPEIDPMEHVQPCLGF